MALLAACSDADVASPGATDTLNVIVNPGGGTAGLASLPQPSSQSDCDAISSETTFVDTFTTPGGTTVSACTLDGATTAITSDLTFNDDGSGTPVVIVNATTIPDGVTLNIDPGLVFFGCGEDDALFIAPGGQINAAGTADNPIIFTSVQDLEDDGIANASSAPGEWGGLVISGNAPINDCDDPGATPGSAGCTKDGEGGSGSFGGDDPSDNSGTLRYVGVYQAGILFSSLNELNGIAFQGVGDATTVEFVQVANANDDGIEFFGGTVNARNLVVTGAQDDSLDWTDGWVGNVQFAIVEQNEGEGNRGIEADNRNGSPDLTPRSNPTLSNFTFIGAGAGGENDGIKLRRGTDATLVNGIVTGFALDGFDFDADSAIATPTVDSVFFGANGVNVEDNADAQAIITAGTNNVTNTATTLDGIVPGELENAVTPTPTNTLGSFFTPASYAGAINPATETADNNWTTGWTTGLGSSACPEGTVLVNETVTSDASKSVCSVTSPIVGNVTLTSGNFYVLEGAVFVGEDQGADPANPTANAESGVLTIEAGTTIFGRDDQAALFVSRGSQLFANGTASAPIVMTSSEDVNNQATAAQQWGGLVINGRAPVNDCEDPMATPGAIDCEKDGEGGSGLFGGITTGDNSGRLNYVRVQYAGVLFSSLNELNGIAFQGVGDGTEVDFVQVHLNGDDGVEFFGGTVDASHIVITEAGDDAFDWTDGWTGSIQFGIASQVLGTGNRLIEGDNRNGSPDLTPRSAPNLANFTLIGGGNGGDSDGVRIRRGSFGDYYNIIITEARDDALDYDDDSAAGSARFFTSLIIDVPGDSFDTDGAAIFAAGDGNEDKGTTTSTLTAPTGFTAKLVPGSEEAITPTTGLSGINSDFVDADYVGAVEDANDTWYQGWTLQGSF